MRGLKVPLVLGLLFRIYIRFLGPKPMILGQEVAGEIEAVGAAVTRFKPGDQVFGWTSLRMEPMPSTSVCRKRGAGSQTGRTQL